MPACHNCGRQTLRTKDWACQWCGYPLFSHAFKQIDKTYKELQEERKLGSMGANSNLDDEPGYQPETASELEPEPEIQPQKPQKQKFSLFGAPKPRPEPKPQPPPRQETPREPEKEPEEAPPQRPVSRPVPPPRPVYKPDLTQRPVPPVSRPETVRPESVVTPPPIPRVRPPAPPVAQDDELSAPPAYKPPEPVAPPPKPEIVVEYQPPYVSSVKLVDIKDGIEISADDLDALFKADKAGVNTQLTGKTIILKGVVEKVFIREHLDIRYIMVTGRKKLSWSSRCTFEKENAVNASRLSENADVAIRGKYDGYGKNIIFKDCEVL
jgi:hypothetical protein